MVSRHSFGALIIGHAGRVQGQIKATMIFLT
jgi:hypothetical protein